MTKEEIISMASKSWLSQYGIASLENGEYVEIDIDQLQELVKLVAAKEREACLEIADNCADADMHASVAANAIRTRGLNG